MIVLLKQLRALDFEIFTVPVVEKHYFKIWVPGIL